MSWSQLEALDKQNLILERIARALEARVPTVALSGDPMTEPRTPSGRGLVRWLMTYGPVDPHDPDAVTRAVVEIERQARLPAYGREPRR